MTFNCIKCSAELAVIDAPTANQLSYLGAAYCNDCKFNRHPVTTASRFTRNPLRATIRRVSNAHYELVGIGPYDGSVDATTGTTNALGSKTRSALESYARANGYAVEFVDARPKVGRYRAGI